MCLKPLQTNNLINKLVKSVSNFSFSLSVFVFTGKHNCKLYWKVLHCMLQEQLLHINTTLKEPVELKKTVAQLTFFVNRQLRTRGPIAEQFDFKNNRS